MCPARPNNSEVAAFSTLGLSLSLASIQSPHLVACHPHILPPALNPRWIRLGFTPQLMVERIRIEDLLMQQISGRKCKFPNSHYKCNPISNFWCKLLPWCKINHSYFLEESHIWSKNVPPPIGSLHVRDCDDWLNIWGRSCSVTTLEPASTQASGVNESECCNSTWQLGAKPSGDEGPSTTSYISSLTRTTCQHQR